MKIGEFFKLFREGVKSQNNNKQLSVSLLSSILQIKADTIRSCERGYTPRTESERNKIKSYFGIENLEEIPNDLVKQSIENFNLINEIKSIPMHIEGGTRNESDKKFINYDQNHVDEPSSNIPSRLTKHDEDMNRELLDILKRSMTQIEEHTAIIRQLTVNNEILANKIRSNGDTDSSLKDKVG